MSSPDIQPGGQGPGLLDLAIWPLVRSVRPFGRLIAGAAAMLALLTVSAAIVYFMTQARVEQASVAFRLTFAGSEEGNYPNGVPFAPFEIVGEPVVAAVAERNGLGSYCPVGVLRSGLFVLETSVELELLDAEYRSRLAVTSLPPTERNRLESEYRQKRAALRHRDFSLVFIRPARCAPIPKAQMQKLLSDILEEWASQAITIKGATSYNVGLITARALPPWAEGSPTVVRLDVARNFVLRILDRVGQVLSLPGAGTLRGNGLVSLTEIRLALLDILRYRIEPLTSRASQTRAVNADGALDYFRDRVFRSKLAREAADQHAAVLEKSLRDYSRPTPTASGGIGAAANQAEQQALMPQLDATFLDRLMTLASASQDVQFKQDLTLKIIEAAERAEEQRQEELYYTRILDSLLTPRSTSAEGALEDVAAQMVQIEQDILGLLDQFNAHYENLSRLNLNGRGALYAISGPFRAGTERPMSLFRALAVALAMWVFAMFLLLLGVLVYARRRTVTVRPELRP